MTSTPKPNQVIRFSPVGRKNRIHVMVTGARFSEICNDWIIDGVRCTSWGSVDSQARWNAWVTESFEVVECE